MNASNVIPARPTALVFASLIMGQLLNLAALSLLSAQLGLADFGRFGLCMLDFAVFANLSNFSLSAASIPMAVRGRFRDKVFSLVMGTRWWTSLAAAVAYIAFEAVFREREMALASLALVPAVILNATMLEWWFQARQSWKDLVVYRTLGGAVTLAIALLCFRYRIGLAGATAAYGIGFCSAGIYLAARTAAQGGLRLPWARPGSRRMRYLWWKSLPLALAGICDFLYIPLGYYVFKEAAGAGPLLGAYGAAYRIILAASMFASSLTTVLLPRFTLRQTDLGRLLPRVFDGMALALAVPMLAVPFLAKPLLTLFFPRAGWDAASLGYASWALSTMALGTYFHLLRMAPLTKALAAGRTWSYCALYFAAAAVNALSVAAGVWFGFPEWLPLLSLAADAVFTSCWLLYLHPARGAGAWARLAALAAWSAAYLAWAWRWA